MRAARLSSTLISRIAHDAASRVLWVTFRHGGCYVYFDVPPELFDRFRSAASAGAFYNQEVKGHFRCSFDPARRRFRPASAA
jgi:hypothetical protein